ncbi:imm11 family protein [Microscilla marina]|nr:DUF1629 domain-containing protein [Microscilla marina]
MKQEYFVLNETFVDDEIYIKNDGMNETERETVVEGKIIQRPQDVYEFYYAKKTLKDFVTSEVTTHVVSEKFKAVLDKIGVSGVAFYPAKLMRTPRSKKSFDNYFMMVVESVSAFDYKNSTYTGIEEENYIGTVQKLEVNASKIEGKHIIRLEELLFPIIITQELKEALEQAQVTGTEYMPINNFHFPVY